MISVDERDKVAETLKNHDIVTGIYYLVPLHLQRCFENLGYKEGDMPNAERVCERILAIPMFPELKETEIRQVVDALNNL